MLKKYWIYEIMCVPSGKRYVGLTSRLYPTQRWGEHIRDWNRGEGDHTRLLAEWKEHPYLAQWTFRIIDEAIGLVDARHKEAVHVTEYPEDMRLNKPGSCVLSFEKKAKVRELLKRKDLRQRDIAGMVGISAGTVSKIKNGHL